MINYQRKAKTFAVYQNELYPFLALSEEVGEMQGVMAKHIRKGGTVATLNTAQKKKLFDELGDVMWNLFNIIDDLGMNAAKIAEFNELKLTNRSADGALDSLCRDEVQ
jgi:NTP pyrophosphatase (non-canonical NTP hydrolase)